MEDLEKYEKDMEYINNFLGEIEKNGTAVIDIDGGEIIKGVIDDLEKSVEFNYDCYQDAGKKMFEYAEENEKLKRQIKIKNEYLQLIHDIGFDYDGMNTVKGLESVIDDLVDLAIKAIKNDDKCVMYEDFDDKYFNILYEEIEKEV